MSKVFFHFMEPDLRLKSKKKIKNFIIEIFSKNNLSLKRIDYIFCSDDYLLKMNNKYLSHNYYTDIITFSLNDYNQEICGEIYISGDRVKENAKIFKVSVKEELLRVILHGVLHLMGYTDKTKKEKKTMRSLETKHLKKLALLI